MEWGPNLTTICHAGGTFPAPSLLDCTISQSSKRHFKLTFHLLCWDFVFNSVCMCVGECGFVHMSGAPQRRLKENLRYPGAGVTGSSELHDVDAGTWIQVLCKSSMCSQPLGCHFSSQVCIWKHRSTWRPGTHILTLLDFLHSNFPDLCHRFPLVCPNTWRPASPLQDLS